MGIKLILEDNYIIYIKDIIKGNIYINNNYIPINILFIIGNIILNNNIILYK